MSFQPAEAPNLSTCPLCETWLFAHFLSNKQKNKSKTFDHVNPPKLPLPPDEGKPVPTLEQIKEIPQSTIETYLESVGIEPDREPDHYAHGYQRQYLDALIEHRNNSLRADVRSKANQITASSQSQVVCDSCFEREVSISQSPDHTAYLLRNALPLPKAFVRSYGMDDDVEGQGIFHENLVVKVMPQELLSLEYTYGGESLCDSKPPSDSVTQVLREQRSSVTLGWNRKREMIFYQKGQIQAINDPWTNDEYDTEVVTDYFISMVPLGLFPTSDEEPASSAACPGAKKWGYFCDVWSAVIPPNPEGTPLEQSMYGVHKVLHDLASNRIDRPIPRYQMVIDPNKFVHKELWVPSEFHIDGEGQVSLMGGARSHPDPEAVEATAVPVLRAALPLLRKLERPAIPLLNTTLQVVVKAQRIIVPAATSDVSDNEYQGLWHIDGDQEPIVAVVLYYHKVDKDLEGGNMEFVGREPLDVLGSGDCENNMDEFGRQKMKQALRQPLPGLDDSGADAQCGRCQNSAIANCQVPIQDGTLLVFSNFQMVHRVLRMVNHNTTRECSRDFMALFIVDPAAKSFYPTVPISRPLLPARSVLARQYLFSRTLRALFSGPTQGDNDGRARVTSRALRLVLEFAGVLDSNRAITRRRNERMRDHLKPRGRFGATEDLVYCMGNGCYTMIGWLDSLLAPDQAFEPFDECENEQNWKYIEAMNCRPREVGRGLSEPFDSDVGSDGLLERIAEDCSQTLEKLDEEEKDQTLKKIIAHIGSEG